MNGFGEGGAGEYFDPGKFQNELKKAIKKYLIPIIIIVIIIAGAMTSFYQVEAEEQAVVLRFGKYHDTFEPGLQFKLPFGIDKVYKAPVKRVLNEEFGQVTQTQYRNRNISGGQILMLTADINVAIVNWVVRYRIKDLRQFLFNHYDPTETLRDVSLTVMSRLCGDYSIDEVLTVGRQEIEHVARDIIQETVDQYETGIFIEAVALKIVEPPEQVKEAFSAVNKALQIRDKIINDAESERNRLIPKARGQKLQMIKEAEGYKIDRINRANGDAQFFLSMLEEYTKSPEITKQRMYLETMMKILPNVSKIYIIDDSSGVLKFLPFESLNK